MNEELIRKWSLPPATDRNVEMFQAYLKQHPEITFEMEWATMILGKPMEMTLSFSAEDSSLLTDFMIGLQSLTFEERADVKVFPVKH